MQKMKINDKMANTAAVLGQLLDRGDIETISRQLLIDLIIFRREIIENDNFASDNTSINNVLLYKKEAINIINDIIKNNYNLLFT
jgi:hypothetical protein